MRVIRIFAILCASICVSAHSQNSEAVETISRISNADIVIIAANLSLCNKEDTTLKGTRCEIDQRIPKCKKFHSRCSELPWVDGLFAQTVIKIRKRADKIQLERFIKKQISPPPKGELDGMFGCFSIEGAILVYKNGSYETLQYDSTNSFLNGIRMDYEFWTKLLKRYRQINKSNSGC